MNAGFLAQHINYRLCYGRASVRLSVPSIDSSNGGRWVYFWAPCSRRRVQQQMRVASCCEPTEEAQHRLAGVAVAVVVIILPSVAEYRDERVCLCICPRAYLGNCMRSLTKLSCMLLMAADGFLFGDVAIRYIYIRFYRWRYVCTYWPGLGDAKNIILRVTQQGATRIWYRGV